MYIFIEYETIIGFNDLKTASGVYLTVQRNTSNTVIGTSIPYELTRLNIGGAMNLTTGIFTVPTNGRYFFSFAAEAGGAQDSRVYLRVNDVNIP